MYKYKIDVNLFTYWEPQDKNLGVSIVKEVTSNRQADEQGYVEVSDEERTKIQELYAERNNDPVPETEEKEQESSEVKEELTKEIVSLKVNDLKKDKKIEMLTKEIVSLKMQAMKGAK